MGRASRSKATQRWARRRAVRRSDVGVVIGWAGTTDPTKLGPARQQTHDRLIAQMGDQRTGPVEWLILDGADARRFMARALAETLQPASARYYRELDKRLRLEGGTLIVASATAVRAGEPPGAA